MQLLWIKGNIDLMLNAAQRILISSFRISFRSELTKAKNAPIHGLLGDNTMYIVLRLLQYQMYSCDYIELISQVRSQHHRANTRIQITSTKDGDNADLEVGARIHQDAGWINPLYPFLFRRIFWEMCHLIPFTPGESFSVVFP